MSIRNLSYRLSSYIYKPVLGLLFMCVVIHINIIWFESRYGLCAIEVKTLHIKLNTLNLSLKEH